MPQATVTPITVSDYAALVRRAARRAGAALVEGEIQRPRLTGGGALVFDLTDGAARLPCKLLPRSLGSRLAHRPREGDLVRVAVRHPDFWAHGGILSVVCEQVRLTGEGELLRRRRELVSRLEAEGLAEATGLPPLPLFPRGVGVIAGTSSSALADVLDCLADRFPAARVFVASCPVQGPGAPGAIVTRLAELGAIGSVDVIVLARGGGSVQDLAAFDDEGLCRALRASLIPVIAAVGHSDNDPVCNLVTHSAHVPRHAAELAVPDRREVLRELDGVRDALGRANAAAREGVAAGAAALGAFAERRGAQTIAIGHALGEIGALGRSLARAGRRELAAGSERRIEALERCSEEMCAGRRRSLAAQGDELERARRALSLSAGRQHMGLRQCARALTGRFAASDFRRQGWVRASGESGRAVTSVRAVSLGDRLRLTLADGELAVRVAAIGGCELEAK